MMPDALLGVALMPELPADDGSFSVSSEDDRRAHPRRPARGAATVRRAYDLSDAGVEVVLENISQGGVSFTGTQVLPLGTRIVMELRPGLAGGRLVIYEAEIRWIASNVVAGRSHFGCRWVRPITAAEVQQFC
jgi:hypothetical protein